MIAILCCYALAFVTSLFVVYRMYPQSWHNTIAVRWEIYGCGGPAPPGVESTEANVDVTTEGSVMTKSKMTINIHVPIINGKFGLLSELLNYVIHVDSLLLGPLFIVLQVFFYITVIPIYNKTQSALFAQLCIAYSRMRNFLDTGSIRRCALCPPTPPLRAGRTALSGFCRLL